MQESSFCISAGYEGKVTIGRHLMKVVQQFGVEYGYFDKACDPFVAFGCNFCKNFPVI